MSGASTSINDLEISARVTRKLREVGHTDTSRLTNSWLDSWAEGLTAKEAQEVIVALQNSALIANKPMEIPSASKADVVPCATAFDDIALLAVSTRLGNELQRLGYQTVTAVEADLKKLPISAPTKAKLRVAISQWRSSSVEERKAKFKARKKVNWFPLSPLADYPNAAELIDSLLEEALASLEERQNVVLRARAFVKDPQDFQTLQALADSFGLTRERIRQIEMASLKKVRKLALECKPFKMLVPRPELEAFWQPLLSELHDLEEISIAELSKLISATLKIPEAHQNRILALLAPLLTLSVSDDLSARAREGAQDSPVSDLPDSLLNLPITHLRLGSSTATLIEQNILTLEDFYLFCQVRRSQLGKRYKGAFDALTSLTRDDLNRSSDPELQLSYALNLHIHPFAWQGGVAETYTSFIPWFTQVIGIVLTWGKAEEVFRLRTSLPAGQRMTLSDLAFKLAGNTNGGHAGNIERYILDEMTKIFVHKDLSKCPIHIPSEISALMDILTSCFSEAAGNFELFSTIISYRLDIPEVEVSKSSHLFWALLTGNLPNRYWHLRNRSTNDAAAEETELDQEDRVVKLKGFRTTY